MQALVADSIARRAAEAAARARQPEGQGIILGTEQIWKGEREKVRVCVIVIKSGIEFSALCL